MSFPLDVAAQNAALDALLGDGAAAGMPSQWELAAFAGDPATTGTEFTATGGYARPIIDNDSANFPDADGGQKVSVALVFADPSGPWVGGLDNVVTHWALIDHADSTTRYFSRPLAAPFIVFGTEPYVAIQAVLNWNQEGI